MGLKHPAKPALVQAAANAAMFDGFLPAHPWCFGALGLAVLGLKLAAPIADDCCAARQVFCRFLPLCLLKLPCYYLLTHTQSSMLRSQTMS